MIGRVELTPDELAKLVSTVMVVNGLTHIRGLALYDEQGQLVGYAKAVIEYVSNFDEIKVYPKPDDGAALARLKQMLSPDVELPSLGTRSGTAAGGT